MLARAVELTQQSLVLSVLLSLPVLVAAAAAGLLVGVFSASTQVHDASLSHLPRLLAVTLALVVFGAWGGATMLRYTAELWRSIPALVR